MAPICHHFTENGISYGIYLLFTKIKTPRKLSVCKGFGGERGIRTLGTLLTYTRFPVVRLRPAQPSLHVLLNYVSRLVTGSFHINRCITLTPTCNIISDRCPSVKLFQQLPVPRQTLLFFCINLPLAIFNA